MKILFFVESLYRGGKERRAVDLMQFLKRQNDIEIILVLTEDKIYYQSVFDLGIPIIILKRKGIKYDPGLFIKFYKCCRQYNPDIIHAWGKMTVFYAIPARLIRRIPLISSMISDSVGRFARFSFDSFFFNTGIFLSDVILSNSKSGLSAYNIKTPKAKVIPNGVNLERFRGKYDTIRIREEFGISSEFILIMVASFTGYKDYDLFIDTAREIAKLRDDTTFLGVGDGPEWNRIQKRVQDENIKNVILTGMRTDIESLVTASDIGLLCTFNEGISNSIIEYMALGKPVISTDRTGGSREIIIDGETGFCVERRTEEVVAHIIMLLNNQSLRLAMGENGKNRISSQFSIGRMGDEFLTLYKDTLLEKSRH
jgi:glycosyltransferase involved in cell wall biosynthesis